MLAARPSLSLMDLYRLAVNGEYVGRATSTAHLHQSDAQSIRSRLPDEQTGESEVAQRQTARLIPGERLCVLFGDRMARVKHLLASESATFDRHPLAAASIRHQRHDAHQLVGVETFVMCDEVRGGDSEANHDGGLDGRAIDDVALRLPNHVHFEGWLF